MTNCKLNIVFEEQSHCENTGVADRQFALFVSNRHRIGATHTHIALRSGQGRRCILLRAHGANNLGRLFGYTLPES